MFVPRHGMSSGSASGLAWVLAVDPLFRENCGALEVGREGGKLAVDTQQRSDLEWSTIKIRQIIGNEGRQSTRL